MITVPSPSADKPACRAFYRQRARRMIPQGAMRQAAETSIREGVITCLASYPSCAVALFCAAGHEPDLAPLFPYLHERGHMLCLPCSITTEEHPVFRRYIPGDLLQTIGKPSFTQPKTSADICVPEVIICPLLAFDDTGTRLGQGGGYYDRAVELYKPRAFIGAAFSALRSGELLPAEPHDARMDGVVTEDNDC